VSAISFKKQFILPRNDHSNGAGHTATKKLLSVCRGVQENDFKIFRFVDPFLQWAQVQELYERGDEEISSPLLVKMVHEG